MPKEILRRTSAPKANSLKIKLSKVKTAEQLAKETEKGKQIKHRKKARKACLLTKPTWQVIWQNPEGP